MLKVFKKNPNAIIPRFATEESACFDLSACLLGVEKIKCYTRMNEPLELYCTDRVEIPAEFRVLIPTGLIFDIPEKHSLRVHARSGLSFKNGLVLQNGEGIIDSDYVEECFVMLKNDSLSRITIEHGMRIAQAEMVLNLEYIVFESLERPQKKTDRNGGFGSTGVKSL